MNIVIIKGYNGYYNGRKSLVEVARDKLIDEGFNCSDVWEPTGDNQHVFMVWLPPYRVLDLDDLHDDLSAYRIIEIEDLVALMEYKIKGGGLYE